MTKIFHKKEKLIAAASNLIYENGFGNTSLADIAKEADVPLGNVYYYFKSKESLARAVIHMRKAFYEEQLARMNNLESPVQRLLVFLDFVEENSDALVKYGCPIGSLCQELDKTGESFAEDINALVRANLEWVRQQFSALNLDNARSLAIEFLSNIQGATLIANSLNDKSIILDRLAGIRKQLTEYSVKERAL